MSTATAVHADERAPGLYRGLTYDQYDAIPAVRHSILRHFARTPAHAHEAIANLANPTDALTLGHAAHAAILEPDYFAARFVAAPKFDKRTNVGKAGWAQFQADHAGLEILDQDEHALCLKLREAAWRHPMAAALLRGQPRNNEVVGVWRDGATGRLCKIRVDRLTTVALPGSPEPWSVVCDLKTTEDARPFAFARDLNKFGYHEQAAYYIDGLDALAPRARRFVFIVVEKRPPFAVACYELDEDAIEVGRAEYLKHLRAYADCVESGAWPGFGDGIAPISLPSWAFKAHGEDLG